jgi:hypothetical protein
MSRDMPLIAIVTLPFAGSYLAAPFLSNARQSMLGSSTAALVVWFWSRPAHPTITDRQVDPKPHRMVAELDLDLTLRTNGSVFG